MGAEPDFPIPVANGEGLVLRDRRIGLRALSLFCILLIHFCPYCYLHVLFLLPISYYCHLCHSPFTYVLFLISNLRSGSHSSSVLSTCLVVTIQSLQLYNLKLEHTSHQQGDCFIFSQGQVLLIACLVTLDVRAAGHGN